jgi:hypothetical protein
MLCEQRISSINKAVDLIVEVLIYLILFFWTETVKVRVGR